MSYIITCIRILVISVYWFFLTTISFILCLFKPFSKEHMYKIAFFVKQLLKPVYGFSQVYVDTQTDQLPKTAVYISNHQNTLDIILLAKAIQPNTVTVGKKTLAFIPFFGWMYWISGNILLNRKVASKAYETIKYIVKEIKENNLNVWLFPEGTRSYGRYPIGEFKVGAFLTALEAGVPIVPVVVSNLNSWKWGKFKNDPVIIKYLKPINTKGLTRKDAKKLAKELELIFLEQYQELNQKVNNQDFAGLKANANFKFINTEEYMASNEQYQWKHLNSMPEIKDTKEKIEINLKIKNKQEFEEKS